MNRYQVFQLFTFTFLFVFCFIVYPLMGLDNKQPVEIIEPVVASKPEFKFIQAKEESKSKDAVYIKTKSNKEIDDFWKRVRWIESRNGTNKYQFDKRLGYKPKDCKLTFKPCGDYQINKRALVDIGCKTKQCMIDRNDHDKALVMAKKILAKKLKRYSVNEDWLKYNLYQQGASGVKKLHLASKGKAKLSKKAMRNIAKNSIYSMRDLKTMGSRKSAISYLNLWHKKWIDSGLQIAEL